METILCPTDFSPSSENAVHYAGELAQCMNSRMVLFHNIYEPIGTELSYYSGVPYAGPFREPEYRQAQQEKLDTLRKSLQQTSWGMHVAYETKIKYGLIQDTILQVAQEEQADMLVLGKEGFGGLKELLTGSVAADVIKNAPCPVLIIPFPGGYRPIRKIVFATDLKGEPFNDVALVVKLAGMFDAEILFLHILPDTSPYTEQAAQVELERLHKRFTYKNASFNIKTSPHIEDGISQFCHQFNADMLVMGYHSRSFWQELFAQDHTREMAFHTSLPLLILHYRH